MSEEMDRALKSNFYGLSRPFVVLLIIEPKDYQEALVSLMRLLSQKEGMEPVYITTNKSCIKLDEIFRVNGINTDNVYYIDAASKATNEACADNEKAKYTSGPANLGEISAEISRVASKPHRGMVFIIDNVSGLLVYNKEDEVSKFLHFTAGKAELTNTSAVFVAMKEDRLPANIGQYADRIIELKYVY
ncbi:MAG TPA: hypothetical protein HA254_07810 [Candidatus Diapherotrites archaeon]|uniref:KaiC-like domain-containing protein n=1 Tax=Candidatus Iainarchaeum sp. TaxID=3101447 RepID=A0A7J4IYC7_9ARCH|nr:hypothetical protein [Candidatus Diapherotrites archaeon]